MSVSSSSAPDILSHHFAVKDLPTTIESRFDQAEPITGIGGEPVRIR
jgi:hypothetical protein